MSQVVQNYEEAVKPYWGKWVGLDLKTGPYTGDTVKDGRAGTYYGECVSFVKAVATGLRGRRTQSWKQGRKVHLTGPLDPSIPPGTVIATFDSHGSYSGHTAILTGQNSVALSVIDQWIKSSAQNPPQPVHKHVILFHGGKNIHNVNDGDNYYVVG